MNDVTAGDRGVIGGADEQARRRRSFRVVGIVSTSHFLSHLYLLVIPPLFPLLRDDFGVSFTSLGLAMTLMGVTSGITQAPVGFLVDRFGARNILVGGLLLEAAAIALIGILGTYHALLALMVVAGIANSVHHPANYSLLNASVDPAQMGRGFSVHTFAGMLGNAMAPIVIIALASLVGWRTGLVMVAVAGAVVALLILANSAVLIEASPGAGASAGEGASGPRGMRLLLSTPIVMGLLFFVGISLGGQGLSVFGTSVLTLIYDIDLDHAGGVLSFYLFAVAGGVLLGGWVADRFKRHDLNAAMCFAVSACALFAVAAIEMPVGALAVMFAVAGLFNGVVSPSRDMLIRSVTPPGEMGKVFGFVSVGFNIGSTVAPLLFGWILDHASPRDVFWTAGVVSVLTIATVLVTGREGRRAGVPAA